MATTSLKVDWPEPVIQAVWDALVDQPDLREASGLELYLGVSEATIKMSLTPAQLDLLEAELDRHSDSEHVATALRDIRGYREAVAAVKAQESV